MTRLDPSRLVEKAARRFLDEQFALFPESGSSSGLETYDSELSKNDPATHRAMIQLLEEILEEVESIPASECAGDVWLDRRLLLAQVRIGLLTWRDLERWRNDPQIHADRAIHSVFDLILRDPENWKKNASSIRSRLAKIPDFLAAGASCVRKPVPLWTKLAIQSCEGAVSFFSDLLKEFPGGEKREVQAIFKSAKRAFTRFADAIADKEPGPEDGYDIGKERFEFMIRENLGLDYSACEAERIGLFWVEKLQTEIAAESKKFGKKAVVDLVEEASANWQPEGANLLEAYRSQTERIRQLFLEKDLLTFPENDSLHVMAVPEFMQHQFPTAAYHAPGPFAKRQQGIFWVNDLSLLAKSPKAKQKEVAQHYGMELTCAHEAYPGHHLQFVLQNRHASHIRRTAHHPIYFEGWTLWCEKMCVDFNIYDSPLARVTQLRDALWRACRIVIDCRLHTGRGGFSGACKFLRETAGFTSARARNDVNWYTSAPTTPMSYLLGRLEVERLHEMLVLRRGWSMRRLNDWMLSFGAIPWSWIRREALDA